MPGSAVLHKPSLPATATAAAQLWVWKVSPEGQEIWESVGPLPSIERISLALDHTQANCYGLLLAPEFFTIIARFHQPTFVRLEDRYQAAARLGLCFWWDGQLLHRCTSGEFFAFLSLLPPFPSVGARWKRS
jgi:hypothetical protein